MLQSNAIDAAGDDDHDECHVMHKIESLYNFPILHTQQKELMLYWTMGFGMYVNYRYNVIGQFIVMGIPATLWNANTYIIIIMHTGM